MRCEGGEIQHAADLAVDAIDHRGVNHHLRRQQSRGVLTIEYAHLSGQLATDVAQCLTFVETWAKGLAS